MSNAAEIWRAFWAGFVIWPVLIGLVIGLPYAVQQLRDKWIGDRVQELEEKCGNESAKVERLQKERNDFCRILEYIYASAEPGEITGEALENLYREIYQSARFELFKNNAIRRFHD